ncbi:hypothetical protein LTR37_000294 [Vermiconidia calcicola]|uniref:Uncharacterized protein n=1 Tax=Vermiconidia calcicola TaxID=1690605 RepID=A0ACC3P039_9PEZI|nr:hypothetical protein LTR37_000294 [Vermiconidia calcicola]
MAHHTLTNFGPRGLLGNDPETAHRMFLDLLQQPRISHWMRVQCNHILSYIADSVESAESYLSGARHVCADFKEARTHLHPDPLRAQMEDMERGFEDAEREIAERKEHPWPEDEREQQPEVETELEGSDDKLEKDEMLREYESDPNENELTSGINEMLLGERGDLAKQPRRTRSPLPNRMEVDSEYTPATVLSAESQQELEGNESETTVGPASPNEAQKH